MSHPPQRHRAVHARRTADTQAAFLLPHLRPGMDLLDLGCGPGTVTTGLAAAVAPGRTVGLDHHPLEPDPAVHYVQGDAHHLPFPDASFDAVFASALLQHVAEPAAVLAEIRRVARPGAVVGLVDADWDGQLAHPADPLIERGTAIAAEMRLRTSSPYVGRRLRALLAEAGFVGCRGFARVGCDADEESAAAVAAFSAEGYESPEAIERFTSAGLSTPDEMRAIAAAWRAWGADPGAYLARLWCEAIGFAPG